MSGTQSLTAAEGPAWDKLHEPSKETCPEWGKIQPLSHGMLGMFQEGHSSWQVGRGDPV